MNKVILVGYAGSEPEVKQTANGTQVARLGVATSKNRKDKDGNWTKETTWHTVILWKELAERKIGKGDIVSVEGEIEYRTSNEGKQFTYIVANSITVVHRKEQQQPQSNAKPTPVPADAATDDLPF